MAKYYGSDGEYIIETGERAKVNLHWTYNYGNKQGVLFWLGVTCNATPSISVEVLLITVGAIRPTAFQCCQRVNMMYGLQNYWTGGSGVTGKWRVRCGRIKHDLGRLWFFRPLFDRHASEKRHVVGRSSALISSFWVNQGKLPQKLIYHIKGSVKKWMFIAYAYVQAI